ncbi:MAG: type I-E CRISPR-associated protein Cse2/CasB [Limnobacter sp.]|uniref:type I-E CRISPR-associated protein Cse2/CasB n=1 Tax=Limnobacter sp. TaxID=2003368 RepID=UPI002736ACE9|nr:type I-E CRISPR-associated protein Cse2/CasB [Limnobacter sp.]MDP3187979.1 type I-E CRISPR-associated protein Cse2/CasB [Limnobacter sp.]
MNQVASPSKADAFIDYLCANLPKDKGAASRLRRADNPSTEHMSWEILAKFNIDLEKPYQRIPYALVAASLAKSKNLKSGSFRLGSALRLAFSEAQTSPNEPAAQAVARLRRILSCSSTEELCRVLRPVLTLIQSRVSGDLDYARLLNQLLRYHHAPEKVQAQIAQEFYSYSGNQENEENQSKEVV